jgi:spore maturation protein CgeB
MRILVAGPSLLIPWTDYTVRALERLGHTVKVVHHSSLTLDRFTLRKGRQLIRRSPVLTTGLDRLRNLWMGLRDGRLLRASRSFRPNLILILWGRTLSPGLLRQMKQIASCPLVGWWVDDPFRNATTEDLTPYDRLFLFDRSYLSILQENGITRAEFLPCAADETIYRPRSLSRAEWRRYHSDIALVAWFYPQRAALVNTLRDFEVKVWGKGWDSSPARQILNGSGPDRVVARPRFVPAVEACKIYSASKIGLNVHSDQTHQSGLNMRSFELLAAGAFQLVDAVPGMEELLEPGRDLAVYHSAEEARDLSRFYLSHPEERARIAAQGRERVLRQHTYVHRMRALLEAAAPL